MNIFFTFFFYSMTSEKEGVSIPNLLRLTLPWDQVWVTWQKAFPNPSHLFQAILRSLSWLKNMTRYHSILKIFQDEGFCARYQIVGRAKQLTILNASTSITKQNVQNIHVRTHLFWAVTHVSMSLCKGWVTQPVRNSSLSCDLAPFTLPQAGDHAFIAVSY